LRPQKEQGSSEKRFPVPFIWQRKIFVWQRKNPERSSAAGSDKRKAVFLKDVPKKGYGILTGCAGDIPQNRQICKDDMAIPLASKSICVMWSGKCFSKNLSAATKLNQLNARGQLLEGGVYGKRADGAREDFLNE